MRRSFHSFRAGLGRLLHARFPIRIPALGTILACLSILGLAGLCYVLWAAVMFFRLRPSDFLTEAFAGSKAWFERGKPALNPFTFPEAEVPDGVTVDKPGQTCDGFTLFTTNQGARATLVDMRGKVIHQWELPFRQAWPRAPHVENPLRDEQIHWFRCHLFPNGDLLAIYQSDSDTPSGYGLVKLDKDSKLLGKYDRRVHHDLDVDENGTIYMLTHQLKREAPAGLDYLPTPYVADTLVALSPDGREVDSFPVEE